MSERISAQLGILKHTTLYGFSDALSAKFPQYKIANDGFIDGKWSAKITPFFIGMFMAGCSTSSQITPKAPETQSIVTPIVQITEIPPTVNPDIVANALATNQAIKDKDKAETATAEAVYQPFIAASDHDIANILSSVPEIQGKLPQDIAGMVFKNGAAFYWVRNINPSTGEQRTTGYLQHNGIYEQAKGTVSNTTEKDIYWSLYDIDDPLNDNNQKIILRIHKETDNSLKTDFYNPDDDSKEFYSVPASAPYVLVSLAHQLTPVVIDSINISNFTEAQVEVVSAGQEDAPWMHYSQAEMAKIWNESAETKLITGNGAEFQIGKIEINNSHPEFTSYYVYGVIGGDIIQGPTLKETMPVLDKNGNKIIATETSTTNIVPLITLNDQGAFQMIGLITSTDALGFIDDFGKDGIQPVNNQPCSAWPGKWNQFMPAGTRVYASFGRLTITGNPRFVPNQKYPITYKASMGSFGISAYSKSLYEPFINMDKKMFKANNGVINVGNFSGIAVRITPGALSEDSGVCLPN